MALGGAWLCVGVASPWRYAPYLGSTVEAESRLLGGHWLSVEDGAGFEQTCEFPLRF